MRDQLYLGGADARDGRHRVREDRGRVPRSIGGGCALPTARVTARVIAVTRTVGVLILPVTPLAVLPGRFARRMGRDSWLGVAWPRLF